MEEQLAAPRSDALLVMPEPRKPHCRRGHEGAIKGTDKGETRREKSKAEGKEAREEVRGAGRKEKGDTKENGEKERAVSASLERALRTSERLKLAGRGERRVKQERRGWLSLTAAVV